MGVWRKTPRAWDSTAVTPAALPQALNDDLRGLALGFGALTSYTPTLTGFTPGNGTAAGAYLQVQMMVYFWAKFTFGSTSAAASTTPKLSLPVTASTNASNSWPESLQNILNGGFKDAGTNIYRGFASLNSTTTVEIAILGSNGAATACSTTSPFTWTTNDAIVAAGWYEAA